MPNLVYSAIGFLISLVGATIIGWPIITRTQDEVAKVAATMYGGNLNLGAMLIRERNFARVGIGMVIVGSCLQFLAATL